jgi:hypothetical protein
MTEIEQEYIKQLTPIELKAYEIAQRLGSSFSLRKSIGFVSWKKKRDEDLKK